MRLRIVLAGAIALACACRKPEDAAQTIVWIDAEPTAQRVIARLRVQAAGPMDHLEPTVETKEPKWPIKLVLAPKNDDASRRFTLHVEGRNDGDDRLMTIQFATGFVAEESRYARLMIHDECVQAVANCKTGEVCNVWAIELGADSLGHSADSPRKIDALCGANDMLPPRAGAGGSNTTMMPVTAAGSSGSSGSGGAGGSNPSGVGMDGCSPGFVRMLGDCVDMDECQMGNPCGDHGKCQNTPGDYACDCEPGFQSVSGSCMPAGDCQTNNGGCEGTCENAPTGPRCACAADQWLKADRKTCGTFSAATQVNMGASTQPTRPRFAFDPSGNGLAAWSQADGMGGSLWIRRFAAGSGWDGPPMKLMSMGSGTPSDPRISLDSKGRGLMVWTQTTENTDSDVWAAQYDGMKFGPPMRIDESAVGSAEEVVVGVDANGDGYAAWSGSDGEHSRIWFNRFKLGGTGGMGMGMGGMGPGMNAMNWSGPQTLASEADDEAFTPQLSVDSQGHALLVWTQSSGGDMGPLFSPWTSRFDLTMNRWRSPVELDKSGAAGYPDGQVFGSDGHSVAVWPHMTNGRVTIRASTLKGTTWSDSVDIGMGDSGFTTAQPRVSLSPEGNGAAVWTEYESPQAQVWSNRYDAAADHWLGPVQLSSFEAVAAPAPVIAVDPNGDGFAVWAEVRGTREIKAWRLEATDGFVGGVTLATDMAAQSPLSSGVQIAVDAKGNAVAIWDSWEDGTYTVWSSTFD